MDIPTFLVPSKILLPHKCGRFAAALAGPALAAAASAEATFDAGVATSDMLRPSQQEDEKLIVLICC